MLLEWAKSERVRPFVRSSVRPEVIENLRAAFGVRMLDTRFVGQNRFYMHNNFLFGPIGPKNGREVRTGVL